MAVVLLIWGARCGEETPSVDAAQHPEAATGTDVADILDASVDAAVDAAPLCPEIPTRQSVPELMDHGSGLYCGPNCRQVTFADSSYRFDVWGDYVVYVSHYGLSGAKNAYLANVITGEEWRLDTGAWQQPGCTRIAIGNGTVSWVLARYPGGNQPPVQLLRTFDLASQGYTDLSCIYLSSSEYVVIWDLDMVQDTLSFYMSNECSDCQDLYTVSLFAPDPVRRTTLGGGISDARAGGDNLVVWTDLNQNNTEIKSYDLNTDVIENLSNHPADQYQARIHHDKVVWVDHRNDLTGGWFSPRNSDIYYLDLITGDASPVTTHPAQQAEPDIDGDLVVWGDWRNNPNPVPEGSAEFINADIYMKRLSTGQEVQLTDFPGIEYHPRVLGNRVFFSMDDGNNTRSIFMIELP